MLLFRKDYPYSSSTRLIYQEQQQQQQYKQQQQQQKQQLHPKAQFKIFLQSPHCAAN